MSHSLISIAEALAGLVPGIARWFMGNDKDADRAHHISRKIIDVAKSITGAKDASTALSLLKQDPKALIEFQKTILAMEHDLEEAYLNDRQDARYRDMAFIQAGKHNKRADVMVISAALGLLSCLMTLCLFTKELPGEAVGIISTIAGIFGSCLKDAYSFEFGSSRGSKAKDFATFLDRH